jgi:hypothetical protein
MRYVFLFFDVWDLVSFAIALTSGRLAMNNPYLWGVAVLFVSTVIARSWYKYKKWQKAIEYKKELNTLTKTLSDMHKRLFDLAKQRVSGLVQLPNTNSLIGEIAAKSDYNKSGNKLKTMMKIGAVLDDNGIGLSQVRDGDNKVYRRLTNQLDKTKREMSNHLEDNDNLNKAIAQSKLYSWGLNSFYLHTQILLRNNQGLPPEERNVYCQLEQIILDKYDEQIESVRKIAIKSYLL